MTTPIEILEEMIKNPFNSFSWQYDLLKEAKERIEKECTIRISWWDNDYDIPYWLVTQFNKDCHCDFQEPDEEWYEWCDEFDKKYAQYQV